MLTIFEKGSEAYTEALGRLSRRGDADLERVENDVREIITKVREQGDRGLMELTERFEGRIQQRIALEGWAEGARQASAEVRELLERAAARVRAYHEHQRDHGFRYTEQEIELGLRVMPLRSVGVYAPGGKARYPSTVLMCAVPAQVAGVERIVLATPDPTPELLAAAEASGVTEVVDCGGAQAVAALAYGTQSVRPVDKIVGPGNIYVSCAKRLVFGTVDIDSLAGPSEILVVADQGAKPGVVAADLLSQAEHDEAAYPLLVTLTREQADAVAAELERQIAELPRYGIATESVREHGFCFVAGDLDEAARVADTLAPEHLVLSVGDPDALLERIRAAGAAFLGYHTPEATGDYTAGPSHVLPTGGTARFSSPLGVYDFVTRTSIVRYAPEALERQGDLIEALARLESFEAHARSVSVRRGRG